MAGTLTLGALVAFLQYSSRFFRPISDMSEKFNVLQSAMASSERIFKLIDERRADHVARRARTSRSRAVRRTSCSITCGSPITARTTCCATSRSRCSRADASASSGATGSGKTTIINLLMRFYDVSRGRILVDGTDIRELALEDVRALFGLVLQDVHLFSGSIGANIRLGETRLQRR